MPGSPSKLDASMDSTSAVGTSNEDDMKRLTVSDLKTLFASNDEQLPLTSAPAAPVMSTTEEAAQIDSASGVDSSETPTSYD